VPGWFGFWWTSPNTLLGLLLGALTFQAPRVQDGVVIFDKAQRGLTWIMPRLNRSAMTLGLVIISAEPVSGALLVHEMHHVKQFRTLGPFFIPVYFAIAAARGYRRHPMERAARRAAGEPD
jgi:hypothetical protein